MTLSLPVGPVNLRGATRLQSLTLRNTITLHNFLPEILSTITSSQLTQLRFTVREYLPRHTHFYEEIFSRMPSTLLNVQEMVLICKGPKEVLEIADTELKSIFEEMGAKYSVVVVHTSSLKRWWRSKWNR